MYNYFASINYAAKNPFHDFTNAELEAYMDYLWYKYDTDLDGYLEL